MNIAKKFVDALKEKKKPSGYDTAAVVKRIEDGTAWVAIEGGIDETPVKLSIDAKPGDNVNVRLSGGRAWITGNNTAPPTDDKKADAARKSAAEAIGKAKAAAEAADDAARTATSYITDIDNGGIRVADKSNKNNHVQITGEGMTIVKDDGFGNAEEVAVFGEAARIGKNDSSHMILTSEKADFVNEDGNAVARLYFGGTRKAIQSFVLQRATGYTNTIQFGLDGRPEPDRGSALRMHVTATDGVSKINEIVAATWINGAEIIMEAESFLLTVQTNTVSKTLIFTATQGLTSLTVLGDYYITVNGTVGFSVGSGNDCTSNGDIGITFGMHNAAGDRSMAAGESCEATGETSVAEGYATWADAPQSHAEGYGTYAGGEASHAEGIDTSANGDYSHAGGQGTQAMSRSQTAVGAYNVADANTEYLHIVGNGSNGNNRSNAHAIDWNGNVRARGKFYEECGNDSTGGTALPSIVDTITISAGTVAADNYATGTASASKIGYTPAGIVGYYVTSGSEAAASMCNVYRLDLSGTNIRYGVRNVGSAAHTFTIAVKVLYR